MKTNSILSFLSLTAMVTARPMPKETQLLRREVPQEHSHEQFITAVRTALNLNNPAGIGDPVFGLLGNEVCLLSKLFQLLYLIRFVLAVTYHESRLHPRD